MPNGPQQFASNPLMNDDPFLANPTATEFRNPIAGLDMGIDPTRPLDLGGMPDVQADLQSLQRLAPPRPTPQPQAPQGPQLFYSPSTGDIVVNGFQFNQRNATQALASREWALQPPRQFTLPDTATDWRPMSVGEYSNYIQTIENPSFSRRMGEAWEHAWRGVGDTAVGAGLAISEATGNDWEWGQRARQSLLREYEENAPFMMQLRDVRDIDDGLVYASQMLVQGVPWLVETMASMAAGGLIGGAVSGGIGAPAGAIEGFIAKEAFRRGTLAAIRGPLTRGANAYRAAIEAAGGRALSREAVTEFAERQAIASADDVNRFYRFGETAYHLSRGPRAGAAGMFGSYGAIAGATTSNYLTGVGDIRNSIQDAGGDPTSAEAVANIWGLAIPYAVVESLGDLVVTAPITRLLPEIGQGASRVGNVLRGAAMSAPAEGIQEGVQYGITQQGIASATDTPLSIEPIDLLESVVGGALAGAGMGGLAGLLGEKTEPTAAPAAPAAPPAPVAAPPVAPAPTTPPTPGAPSVYEDPYALGGLSYDGLQPMGQMAPQFEPGIDTGTHDTPNVPEFTPGSVYTPPGPSYADMADQEIPGADLAPAMPMQREPNIGSTAVPQIGDLIQWSPQGMMQFSEPRRVAGISPDGQYLFVEGSNAGVPINETSVVERAPRSPQPTYPPVQEPAPTQPAPNMGQFTGAIQAAAERSPRIKKMMDTLQLAAEQGVFVSPQIATDVQLIAEEAMQPGFPPEHQAMALMAPDEVANLIRNHNRELITETLNLIADSEKMYTWPVEKLDRAIKLSISALANAQAGFTPDQVTDLRKLGGAARAAKLAIPPKAQQSDGLRGREQVAKDSPLKKKKRNRTGGQKRKLRKHKRALARKVAEQETDEQRIANRIARTPFGRRSQMLENRREQILADAEEVKRTLKTMEEDAREAIKVVEAKGQLLKAKEFAKKVEKNPERYGVGTARTKDDGKRFTREDAVGGQTYTVNEGTEWAEDLVAQPNSYLLRKPDGKLHSVITEEDLNGSYEKKEDGTYGTKVGREVQYMEPKEVIAVPSKESTIQVGPGEDHIHAIKDPSGTWYAVGEDVFKKKYEIATPKKSAEVRQLNVKNNKLTDEERKRADYLLYEDLRGTRYTDEEIELMNRRLKEQGKFDDSKSEWATFEPAPQTDEELKAWINKVLPLTDEQILERMNELVREQNALAKRHADVIDFKAAKERIDALRERSTTSETVGDKPRTSKEDGKRDAPKPEAAAESAAENEQGVPRVEVDPVRFEKLRKALETKAEAEGKDPRQKAAGVWSRVKSTGKPSKQTWTLAAGSPITDEEYIALIQFYDDQKKATAQPKTKLHPVEVKKHEAFGRDASEELAVSRRTKDPKAFEEFVRTNRKEAKAWLAYMQPKVDAKLPTDEARRLKPTYAEVHKVMTKIVLEEGPSNKPMAMAMRERGRPRGGIATDILREELSKNPRFTISPIHPMTRKYADSVIKRINDAQAAANVPLSSRSTLENLLAEVKRRDKNNPQQAAGDAVYNPLDHNFVKKETKRLQEVVPYRSRFRSVHVFKNLKDMWDRAESEMLTAHNGAQVSFGRYIYGEAMRMKAEHMGKAPELYAGFTDENWGGAWVELYIKSKMAVLREFDALVVFSGHMETERELYATFEHEVVGHKGLEVMFPSWEERRKFLLRLRDVPGVEQKRAALVKQYKRYAYISELEQIEEVLTFHMMEGPLVLQRLLEAPEGIDKQTRRTLWEDFKAIIKSWIDRVFLGVRRTEDQALDEITAALRKYVVTGEGTSNDLQSILDKYTSVTKEEIDAAVESAREEGTLPKAMAVMANSATTEDTAALLYGGDDDNPARPTRETPYWKQLQNVVSSNAPLLNKMEQISKGMFGTSAKEALRKVLRNIEPMNNMALRSVVVEKTMDIMHNTIKVARSIISKRAETRHYVDRDVAFDKEVGSTVEERKAYNPIAIAATNNLIALTTEEKVRNATRLVVQDGVGLFGTSDAVFDEHLKAGTIPREVFDNGIQQYVVTGDGKATPTKVVKLSKKTLDLAYEKIYIPETRHMAESAYDTLKHMVIAVNKRAGRLGRNLSRDNFKPADQEFAKEMLEHMYDVYASIAFHGGSGLSKKQRNAQKERARQVLAELMRTMHSQEKVKDWIDAGRTQDETTKGPRKNNAFKWREQVNPHKDVAPFATKIAWFLQNDPATGMNRLERLHKAYNSTDQQRQFKMLGAFQGLLNVTTMMLEHENSVIQSILGGYVEFTRKGEWRVGVEVVDLQGNPADISAEFYAMLPAAYPNSLREAKDLQAELQAAFDGVHKITTPEGHTIDVRFNITRGRAPGVQTLAEAPSLQEFIEVANLAGLKLSATQMKHIANLIESSAERKRYGLQRAGTPGMDEDILKNNSETMTRRAWFAAKTSQADELDEVFNDNRNIYGDWEKLAELQEQFDIANRGAPEGKPTPAGWVRNEAVVYLTETALLKYANQLRHMASHSTGRETVNIRTTTGEQKLKIEGEGRVYHAHAVALKESLERNELELNLNDLLSKTGPARMLAVFLQLGSIASAVMNAFTIITHLPWLLMARHPKTGYGGGLSFSETITEIMGASEVFNPIAGYEDTLKIKELLDAAKAGNNKTGLTVHELAAMYEAALAGTLMPQQTYSLTGGTESNITWIWLRNFVEAFLKPFGNVEAGNRRWSWLATYRAFKRRYILAGVSEEKLNDPTSEEAKRLAKDVEEIIFQAQGDYANINRPRAFRGDFAQYLLMYKMFPLMSQVMLYNLPTKQQLAVLAVLFILGGLKGEPFADDLLDIYDTLMQKLGFRHDSLELSLIQALEDIAPGSSKWIMYGGIDALAFGGTMSSRISMGDTIPLTGVFREGADLGREIQNAFGPAYAANIASLEYAWLLTDFIMQSAGLKPQVTSWEDLIRKMPQSQLRGLGEAGLMAATGEITDPQGRLTSDDVTAGAVFMRALGFYPLEATEANTAVRLDRMHIGYMRAIRSRYILAYATAYRAGNQDRMDNILQSVQRWNEAAEATGQEDMMIRNFRSAAVRAGRAASQTTIERTASSAPNYSLLEEMAAILNADEEAESN